MRSPPFVDKVPPTYNHVWTREKDRESILRLIASAWLKMAANSSPTKR